MTNICFYLVALFLQFDRELPLELGQFIPDGYVALGHAYGDLNKDKLTNDVLMILKKLDELKLAEDTIVVYFHDNGPNGWRWNGGMKGRKGSTDEGGVRSPFLIRWPGKIRAGAVSNVHRS